MRTFDIQLAHLMAKCSRTNVIIISELKVTDLETVAYKMGVVQYLEPFFSGSCSK
jgi:hypothetical protein